MDITNEATLLQTSRSKPSSDEAYTQMLHASALQGVGNGSARLGNDSNALPQVLNSVTSGSGRHRTMPFLNRHHDGVVEPPIDTVVPELFTT